MSNFLYHTNCEKCGSSDANGVYDDGHMWCWSCGKFTPSKINTIKQLENILNVKETLKQGELPNDFTTEIPKEPYAWLKQYSLTKEEISNNNIGWSQRNSMLIFPFYGENNNVVVWQGRYFPARSPKVFTCGYPDNHILLHHFDAGKHSRRVVVVEDSVSAIKVSRVCTSSELLGSNLSMHKALGLSRQFSHLTFWLDYDKISSMTKQMLKYSSLFDVVDMVVTKQDPKMYNTNEIKEYLNAIY